MTDQEINEAVARKLGWKPTKTKYSTFDGQHDAEVIRCRVSKMPDYCHSIAAAWEAVKYIQKMEISVDVRAWSSNSFSVFIRCGIEMTAIANTAPMAICLAFLKMP